MLARSCLLAVVLAFGCAAGVSSARANPSVAVVIGGMEFVGVAPMVAHNGFYPSLGASASFAIGDYWLSPGFGVELAPESGAWGVFSGVSFDVPITAAWKLNVLLSACSDQIGWVFSDVAWYAGPGVGLSYAIDDVWTVAGSVNCYAGLNDPAFPWTIAPGVTVAYTVIP